jgi:hypothetical protein
MKDDNLSRTMSNRTSTETILPQTMKVFNGIGNVW